MPRVCTICAHAKRPQVEKALVAGGAVRSIAKQFSISYPALQRHVSSCVGNQLQKAASAKKQNLASKLLDEIEALHATTMELLTEARKAKDIRTSLRAVTEARDNLQLIARMTGQLEPKQEQGDGPMLTWEEFVVLYRSRTVSK